MCHLPVEGYEACDQLDDNLEALAHLFPRTLFARSPVLQSRGPQAAAAKAALGLQGLPGERRVLNFPAGGER